MGLRINDHGQFYMLFFTLHSVACAFVMGLLTYLLTNLLAYGQGKHRRRKGSVVGGGTMASAEHEPITGVWGQSPQRGPEAEPLVRGSGGEAPLTLKAF